MIDSAAGKVPDKQMIVAEGQAYTYAEVMASSHAAAARLASCGVLYGDVVAIMALNTPEFLVALIGAWRLGAAVVPVNHKLSAVECKFILRHSGAKLFLHSQALEEVAAQVSGLDRLALDGPNGAFPARVTSNAFVPVSSLEIREDQPAQILYTSGTTGKPKGCVHTHGGVVNTAVFSAVAFSMVPSDRTLIAMPIWHAAPLNNFTMSTLFVGGTLILLREYHPKAFVESLQHDQVTVYFGAPVSFAMPLSLPGGVGGYDFSSIRALLYGGGPISAELAQKLAQAYRTDRFHQVYGMTETGPSGSVLYPEEQIDKAGSIGCKAQPGIDMKVVRADGSSAAAGETGEIWFRSPSVMAGYLNDAEATAKALEDGWYRTGDLARVDEDGYLFIVDRLQDMIISGGENVYSKEVEDALYALEQVADCAVIGVPHPEWGETVTAVIVLRPDTALEEDSLREALRARLAPYKIPRRFLAVESLPRTPTGKVVKASLRALFAA